jgi:hypothetical protein
MLTDKAVRACKAREKQYDVRDGHGLALRVNRSSKTWVLVGRWGSRHATRRKLGTYPDMTLAEARDEAARWRKALSAGKDPTVEAQRAKRRREQSFAVMCEEYFTSIKQRGLARSDDIARDMRRDLVSRWGDRAAWDIDKGDVLQLIDEIVARGARSQAHHVFANISRLFNWGIERDCYGIDRSPCDRLRPAKIIGAKEVRVRVLTGAELQALWHACPALGYPMGPLVRLLADADGAAKVGGCRGAMAGDQRRHVDHPPRPHEGQDHPCRPTRARSRGVARRLASVRWRLCIHKHLRAAAGQRVQQSQAADR